MKTFKVGGAIRDKLLGLPIHDVDWVVVGASPSDMTDKGFRIVGSDFPVFLHPETNEEYALARTERKVSVGYKGFTVNADPSITLEQDLFRRDLTINAIAEDEEGNLFDPYNGIDDINNRVIRHVSSAFQEDPVRILRTARFVAKLAPLNFKVDETTMDLMKSMVDNGETDALVPERVWQECASALNSVVPHAFFSVLEQCGASRKLFSIMPDIHALERCSTMTDSIVCRFASLWRNHSHDDVMVLCKHLKVPTDFAELALIVSQHARLCEHAVSAEDMMVLLDSVGAFRRTDRFHLFMTACQANGLTPEKAQHINECFMAAFKVGNQSVDMNVFVGKDFGIELRRLRVSAIQEFMGE